MVFLYLCVMRKSRSKYQRIWEEHNNKKIPKGYHIHHIDGNRNNNTPKNLLCVSAKEHYLIHLKEYHKTGSLKHLAASLFLQPNDNKDKLPSVRVGFKHTEETKLKMSKSKLGKPSWNKGVKMSDEARKNMSDAHKGLKWSDEMRENWIKSRTGGKTKKAK